MRLTCSRQTICADPTRSTPANWEDGSNGREVRPTTPNRTRRETDPVERTTGTARTRSHRVLPDFGFTARRFEGPSCAQRHYGRRRSLARPHGQERPALLGGIGEPSPSPSPTLGCNGLHLGCAHATRPGQRWPLTWSFWWRGQDLNLRPSGYEDAGPRLRWSALGGVRAVQQPNPLDLRRRSWVLVRGCP